MSVEKRGILARKGFYKDLFAEVAEIKEHGNYGKIIVPRMRVKRISEAAT